MDFGNEWVEEKKMAIEKDEDAEKMLQYYIYNRMKKENLHDVAEIYAQEANLEISKLARCEESMLTKWWESFWPTFCLRLSSKRGENVQSAGQLSTGYALAMLASLKNQGASSSGQTPKEPQQNVLPVTGNPVMSHQFTGNAPIIPNFSNVMQENHVSGMLPELERYQQDTRGLYNCDNVIAQSPAELFSAPGNYQHRAGNLPMKTVSDGFLGQSSAKPLFVAETFGNKHLGFAPDELLPGQALVGANTLFYPMPPSGSQSHLQLPALPATMEIPGEVTQDPYNYGLARFANMGLSSPVGPNSTFSMIADHAGEANYWMNQLPPTGLAMAVPGPDFLVYRSRVPDALLLSFHLAAEAYSRLYPPAQ
ncbi:uncharacterized protein LOC141672712 [Apium graveolens]|uniref:uncharacterized protein LOC141672712 n=1 Tax=Apium graveolens TaxID=4045 RepID=UPI003D79226E